VDVNDSFTRLTGHTREEVLGQNPLQLNLWLDFSLRTEVMSQLSAQGELHDAEFQLRTKSGDVRTGLLSGALFDLDGRCCALMVARDITDRKTAEELLRSSEERFRSLVEHLHVGIVWFDAQSRIQVANQAVLDMFGLQLNEVHGRTAKEIGLQP